MTKLNLPAGKAGELIAELCPCLPSACRTDRAGRPTISKIVLTALPEDEKNWYTYVLICENGSLYKDFTNNLKRRFKQHLDGLGAEWTKMHKPLGVIYYEVFKTQEEAVKREKYLKSGCGREWLKTKLTEVIYERCQ